MGSETITAPLEEGSRFAIINETDRSGLLWITSILCMIYSSLIICARLHIKWNMYGSDDVTASIATVRLSSPCWRRSIWLFTDAEIGLAIWSSSPSLHSYEEWPRKEFRCT